MWRRSRCQRNPGSRPRRCATQRGDVYGRNSAGDATGYLKFPEQMEPQLGELEQGLPTAVTDQGLGMFKYEDLPTYFAVPVQ